MSVLTKLGLIQSILKCNKSQYNSFGKYKYRSCEDILEAAKPLCNENGAVLLLSDEVVLIGERFYVKATATLFDAETGDKISNTAYAREEETKKGQDGSQITGTSSSYARKYALNGLFCIDDTKDADTDENHNELLNRANQKPAKVQAAEKAFGATANPVQNVQYVKVENGIYYLLSKNNGKWGSFEQFSARGPEALNACLNDKDYQLAHKAIHQYLSSRQW